MTNAIQLTALENSSTHDAGVTYSTEPFIRVRWGWLAFPTTTLLSSVAFLVLTLLQTKWSRVPAWKGSPLALFFSLATTAK
jgi:hypothetical protein